MGRVLTLSVIPLAHSATVTMVFQGPTAHNLSAIHVYTVNAHPKDVYVILDLVVQHVILLPVSSKSPLARFVMAMEFASPACVTAQMVFFPHTVLINPATNIMTAVVTVFAVRKVFANATTVSTVKAATNPAM